MKIGIIVYSHTGNTFSVAQRLEEKLTAEGHSVKIEKVTVTNDNEMDASRIQLSNIPDASAYDALVFGAPVRGMSLSAAMTAYLSQLTNLKEKSIFCYLTQFFPFPSMGGNRAMGQIKKICESKSLKVSNTGIVNWSNFRREKMIGDIVEKASRSF
ncbi:MAG: flavodoxin/nitric oxide synthase [Clostridia bacterium]|nr:flavodoxin/nitric oxide synthase [Clostridia bacterium]